MHGGVAARWCTPREAGLVLLGVGNIALTPEPPTQLADTTVWPSTICDSVVARSWTIYMYMRICIVYTQLAVD